MGLGGGLATNGQIAASGGSGVSPTGVLYVDQAQGSDVTGTGTGSKPYASITAAINAANAAILAATYQTVTIRVARANYVEEVWITKAINLVAEGGVPGTGYTGAVNVQAPSNAQNSINVVGSGATGIRISGISTSPFSSTATGIGLRITGANYVIVENWAHSNPNTPAKTQGGIGMALSHCEGCWVNGWRVSQASQGLIVGIAASENVFVSGKQSGNYQDRLGGWYEGWRTRLSGAVNASVGTFPINQSVELFAATNGLAIVDSEGIFYAANAAGSLTGVQRAVVGFLTGAITSGQTSGIAVAPLAQGVYSVAGTYLNPTIVTTVPASGSLVLDPGTGSAETITYTSRSANPDGTFTLSGVVRSGTPFAHNAQAPAQDAALASAASHSAGATVIQAYPTNGGSGTLGGGNVFNKYKAVSCQPQTIGVDYVDDWWAGQTFISNTLCESSNTNQVRYRATCGGCEHINPSFAPQTTAIDDGVGNFYRSPKSGALTFSSLSSGCRVENANTPPTNSATVLTDLGTGNDLDWGSRVAGVADGAGPASPSAATTLLPRRPTGARHVDVWPDDLLNFTPATEADVLRGNGCLVNTRSTVYDPATTVTKRAQIVAGDQPGDRPLVRSGTDAGTTGQLILPTEGMLAQDEFTLTLQVRAIGNDIGAPAAPTLTASGTGSTVPVGTYTVAISYTNAAGETIVSQTSTQAVTSGQNLVITSPPAAGNATGWYAYVSQAGAGTLFRQQTAGSPTAIATNLTISAPPTITGLNPAGFWTTLQNDTILYINQTHPQRLVVQFGGGGPAINAILTTLTAAGATTTTSKTATVTPTVGDFPAGTTTYIVVSYDSTSGLKLTAGTAGRTNTATPLTNGLILPWSGLGVGQQDTIAVGPTVYHNFDVGIPITGRRSNNTSLYTNNARFLTRPKITVTAGTTQGAFPRNVAGVVAQFPGSSSYNVQLADPNFLAGLAFLQASNCPLVRIAGVHKAATIAGFLSSGLSTGAPITSLPVAALPAALLSGATITTVSGTNYQTWRLSAPAIATATTVAVDSQTPNFAYPSGSVIVDFSKFDGFIDAFFSRGISIHGLIGYTPFALQSTANDDESAPTSNANFALWASAVVGRYLARATLANTGATLTSYTFWNEPENQLSTGWGGTPSTGFAALYVTTAQKIQTDWPAAPPLDPPDGGLYNTLFQTAVIAAAHTNSLPVNAAYVHDYNGRPGELAYTISQMKGQLTANSYPSAKVRVTEWGQNSQYMSYEAGGSGFAAALPISFSPFDAAFAHAYLCELVGQGIDIATNFNIGALNSGSFFGWMDSAAVPRLFPRAYAHQLFWKHTGNRVSVATNGWPGVRAMGSIATNAAGKTVITLTYSLYRSHAAGPSPLAHDLEWPTGLPSAFTWQQWEISDRYPSKAQRIAQDLSANAASTLPQSVQLQGPGMVGGIQITQR